MSLGGPHSWYECSLSGHRASITSIVTFIDHCMRLIVCIAFIPGVNMLHAWKVCVKCRISVKFLQNRWKAKNNLVEFPIIEKCSYHFFTIYLPLIYSSAIVQFHCFLCAIEYLTRLAPFNLQEHCFIVDWWFLRFSFHILA